MTKIQHPTESKSLQPIIDRLADAGWLTGLNIDHPTFYLIQLTQIGRAHMAKLCKAIRPFLRRGMRNGKRPSFLSWLRFYFAMRSVRHCFLPRKLSGDEIELLLCLVVGHELQNQSNLGNGSRP